MINAAEILKASILIVDDQAADIELLQQMLRGAGYQAVTATDDPRTVCALHREHRYDLILLDLQMTALDGFGVMKGLAEIESGGQVPVLVITALAEHKLRALKAGAKDFVSKPFDLTEVLLRVYNLIEVRLLYRSEAALNLARLENAQRVASLGDWEYNFSADRLRWSEEVYRILGLSRQDCPPDSARFYQQVHPDDLAFVHAQKKAAAAGRRVDFEHRLIRADGAVRHIHQVTAMLLDDRGQPALESGTIQDITERKLADETLRESEERHRTLLMSSPDAHYVQVGGLITLVNPAFCRLMGAAGPEQLLGKPALDVMHPDCHTLVLARRQQDHADEVVPATEMKIVRLDGVVVEVEEVKVAFDIRGHREVHAIQRDITARKAAEIALRESEERFKLVARAVSDVVRDWNIPDNRLWWSDGFLAVFGSATAEIAPGIESWSSRIHPDEHDRVMAGLRHAIETRAEAWSAEYRFRRNDGGFAFVQDHGCILRDPAGRAIRMVAGMRDLTEQKKMEGQYLRAQRMESIGTLAGGIAHDLNNMLAPIMMSIDLLKLDSDLDPRRARILDIIQRSCRRGASLVRQVLTFASGMEGQRVAIRLRPLLDDLEVIIRETFPRNIRLLSTVPENLWPFTGDPSHLHQVLLNLTVNARDAMPHGGALTLTARNITLDAQYAATSPEAKAGPYILLEVADTGEGIAPEVRERIFEPFFTTKEIGRGTGLGLATVHTIVKGHGGFVQVESEVGRGTSFKVYLPADLALATTASAQPFPTELPRGHNELVLVVDDEFSIREITGQTLETFGYRVVTANDGAEAIALYARQVGKIAVVLTDMMMPVMDGAATIQVLRRINPAAKIIAASGIDSGQNVAKVASAGGCDFLPKPYTAETLLKLLRLVLDRPATPAGINGSSISPGIAENQGAQRPEVGFPPAGHRQGGKHG